MTPKDLRIGAWSKLSLPVTVTSAELCEESADKPELWIGCSDGHVYQLQDVSAATYATAASTSAVSASFETHPLPLGPQTDDGAVTGRGEPRYVEVESYSSTGITWTVTVTVLSGADGATLGSCSFSLVCPSGYSQVSVPVPPAGAHGRWCRVSFSNASTTADGYIRNLRLYYLTRVARSA